MSDEQRVRTMCGWVGVEISRSRVRTPGKAGFGLYRVRGSAGRPWRGARELEQAGVPRSAVTEDLHGEHGLWTEYLFELDAIKTAVETAIAGGTPARPLDLVMYHPSPKQARGDRPAMLVPTRWTSAYRGRRDLGVPEVAVPVMLRPEAAYRVGALAALVDEGLVQMWHVPDGCVCEGTSALTMACVDLTMDDPDARGRIRQRQADQARQHSTARQRQREANDEFQRGHLERRAHGLRARYAAKELRNGPQQPRE